MDLLQQAATIMVLGMGLVFVFLAMVILLVQVTAKLVQRHEARSPGDEQKTSGAGGDEPVVAAIAVALHDRS